MSRVRVPDGAPKRLSRCAKVTAQEVKAAAQWARNGSLVKRLRHRPLTPITGVRFPHESPKVGADGIEGPPVPIPNTEVKLDRAENTWLETAREIRAVPTHIILNSSAGRACDC